MKAEYQYTGKQEQRHTIAGEEVVFVDNNIVVLPVGNEHVATLCKNGVIKLIQPVAPVQEPVSKPKKS